VGADTEACFALPCSSATCRRMGRCYLKLLAGWDGWVTARLAWMRAEQVLASFRKRWGGRWGALAGVERAAMKRRGRCWADQWSRRA
jgi:hypothetical protein